ncbi:TPA: hypothetical protein ACH3X1_011870 [Trebouxia sp. C0004]
MRNGTLYCGEEVCKPEQLQLFTGLDGEWCYDKQQSTEQQLVFLRGLRQQHQRTLLAKTKVACSKATSQNCRQRLMLHILFRDEQKGCVCDYELDCLLETVDCN